MENTIKRTLSFLLALTMVLTMVLTLIPMTARAEETDANGKLEIGDFVYFGHGAEEPDIWQVINLDGENALIYNLYMDVGEFDASIHGQTYTISFTRYNTYGSVTWEYSDVRQWLNSKEATVAYQDVSFDYSSGGIVTLPWDTEELPGYADKAGYLNDARFSEEEYWLIQPVSHFSLIPYPEKNKDSVYSKAFKDFTDDVYGFYQEPYGTSKVTDRVFLLNGLEFKEYVLENDLIGYEYPNGNKMAGYWLRDSVFTDFAGFYYYYGTNVLTVSDYNSSDAQADGSKGIRPACYINLNYVTGLSGQGTFEEPYTLEIDPNVVDRRIDAFTEQISLQESIKVTFFWNHPEGDYENSDMWIHLPEEEGQGYLFEPCAYGGRLTIQVPKDTEYLNFYTRYDCSDPGGTEWGTAKTDVEEERTLELNGEDIVVYLKYGDPKLYFSKDRENTGDTACSLSELTTLDYLAFSAIAYLDFDTYGTVQECLTQKNLWDKLWSETQNIKYSELCAHIAQWKLLTVFELSDYNGFYALAFENANNEVVIAYRGSENPFDIVSKISWDAMCDWIFNDLPIELGNSMGPQLEHAIEIYDAMALSHNTAQIAVTGHSLGGAWADTISAYSGCRGVTFNAVSILDVLYQSEPELMAKTFGGVDKWNFVDHTNKNDILAGMFEKYLSTEIKPYVAHTGNINISSNAISAVVQAALKVPVGGNALGVVGSVVGSVGGDIAACHGLDSLVVKDSAGNVVMTDVAYSFSPNTGITNYMFFSNDSVDLGSSGKNQFKKGIALLVPRTSYGGLGQDDIVSSTQKDTLIGGGGNDLLDGGWNDDTYIYTIGDGYDKINDISGNDTLKLYGVKRNAGIDFVVNNSTDYVDIYCDDALIVSVRSKNRSTSNHSFTVEWNGVVSSLTAHLRESTFGSRIFIGCPVDVEIIDEEGNVVYTLKDGVEGNHYTDYGNFYVFEEEDGGYGKVLDLIEGYSVKTVGVAEGAMDITYQHVVDGELSETEDLEDVPVSDTFTGTIEQDEDGDLFLAVDSDGDNLTDERLPFGNGVVRLAGADRFDTAFKAANELKAVIGIEKFGSVVVASGAEFADALAGSYLAAVKSAPILLSYKEKQNEQVKAYIRENLAPGGTVYILGGTSAVPSSMEQGLEGFEVIRLAGADRFETNLLILKEAGVEAGDEILVCTGKEFADSLSASATGKPILLVYKKLTDGQKAYLSSLNGNKFCIVGGENAVPAALETAIKAYGETTRLAGKDRLVTSVMVAEKYFSNPDSAVVAYGWNYPDGLCGGPLAYAMDAPLILTYSKPSLYATAVNYTDPLGIKSGYILGGTGLVYDEAVRAIFSMAAADVITLK